MSSNILLLDCPLVFSVTKSVSSPISCPPLDNILAIITVLGIRGKIIRNSELFFAVLRYTIVHSHMHTDMSSSYR